MAVLEAGCESVYAFVSKIEGYVNQMLYVLRGVTRFSVGILHSHINIEFDVHDIYLHLYILWDGNKVTDNRKA